MKRFFRELIVFCLLILIPSTAMSKIKLPAILGSKMVLQQNSNVPIWGEASAGKEIKVKTSWNNKEYKTISDNRGVWKMKIVTPAYGGPYSMVVTDGEALKLDSIMIGEVWLCSGQSNMEMPLLGWGKIMNFEQEIAAANYPEIRLFQVDKIASLTPQSDCQSQGWRLCSPQTIPGFSATAYFFAKNLYDKYHIPIGLIHTSWGGTAAESWTSAVAIRTMPAFTQAVNQVEKMAGEDSMLKVDYKVEKQKWDEKSISMDRGFNKWMKLKYDDRHWKKMNVPGIIEKQGLKDFDGIVWFRKTIDIPVSWKNKNLKLNLDNIDDNDITYFNGTEIGKGYYGNFRTYVIPAKLVKAGANTITVRIHDFGGDGGFCGKADDMKLVASDNTSIPLSGEWKYCIGLNNKELPALPQKVDDPFRPTVLFNAMINPLIPFKIRGAIWYQGEANTWRSYQYRELLPLMIRDWRERWDSDFPFYIVQIANFMNIKNEPEESDWAELREAQLKTLSLENTGLAVTIDIGNAEDIHPKNKQEVGRRLALIAMHKTYNDPIEYSGPLYESYQLEGDSIRIRFKHAGTGLETPQNDRIKGFAIAGLDHKFYWADAVIDGNEIIVYSSRVKDPVAVRYGWANNPICNLYNKSGLPASPFRTDDWNGLTRNN